MFTVIRIVVETEKIIVANHRDISGKEKWPYFEIKTVGFL
jgi:hypothetical protein